MTYKMVVFDWDGTISDSTGSIVQAIRQACLEQGFSDPGREAASEVIGLGLQEALRQVVPFADDEQVRSLMESYRRLWLKQGGHQAIFEGVIPLLEKLNALGVICAVATGKSRAGLERAFDQTQTRQFFVSSRCADECFSKPHPQMLLELMDEFAFNSKNVLMVGDTTHDLFMAESAQVDAVAVYSGAHPRSLLDGAKHVKAFPSVNEMAPWLIQFIKSSR